MAFLGIGAALFGAGTFIAGVADFAVGIAASIGISYAARALAGKPDAAATGSFFATQGRLQADGAIPRAFLMGRCATAGSLVYANTWGEDYQTSNGQTQKTPNAYFTQVISLSDLPIKALTGVWINNEKVTLTTEPPTIGQDSAQSLLAGAWMAAIAAGLSPFSQAGINFVANYIQQRTGSALDTSGITSYGLPVLEYRKGGKDHLWIKFYDGTQTAADAFLTSKVSSADRPYDTGRVGKGVAYAICTALVDDTLFSGFPQYKFECEGIRLYDPSRDDTNGGVGQQRYADPTTWGGDGDSYPVVQAYNVLRGIRYNGAWMYGLQKTLQANLPGDNWVAQINKCRAQITGDSGPEPTYRSGGQFSVDKHPADALDALMTACQGKVSEVGGYYKLHVGEPDAAIVTITDDDILISEEQTLNPFLGLADSVNGITGTYPDPTQAWSSISAPPLYNTGYETRDGSRRLLANPSFDLVPYAAQVQRLMKSALLAARRERSHNIVLPPPFWVMEPGDVIEWTSARNGYQSKLFTVTALTDKANVDVALALTEVDPSDYNWNHNTDFTEPTSGPTTIVRPVAQPIIDWYAQATIIKDGNGVDRRPAILLSWYGDMPDVAGVQFEVRNLASADPVYRGRTDNVAAGSIVISQNLLPQQHYQVRGRYIPANPRDTLWSDWLNVDTPNILFSILDFENGVADQVTNQFKDGADLVRSIQQLISNAASEQEAANEIQRTLLKELVLAREGALSASIETVKDTSVSNTQAIASLTQTVSAGFDAQSASIQQNATAIAGINGKLAASYGVKLNVNGYASGFQQLNDGSVSAFVIAADVFQIATAGVTPTTVFQVYTTGGTARLGLRGDMIIDGTVTANKMSVATLSAITGNMGSLTTGSISSPDGRFVIDATNQRIVISD